MFVDYLKKRCPRMKFNTIAVFKNIKAEAHKDSHNVAMNVAVPLSDFEGSDIMGKKMGKK